MSSRSQLNTSVGETKSFAARIDPDVWNAAAAVANATHVPVNTIVNDALAYYMSSGQAQAAYVSPVVEKAHGGALRAAIDKLSGE